MVRVMMRHVSRLTPVRGGCEAPPDRLYYENFCPSVLCFFLRYVCFVVEPANDMPDRICDQRNRYLQDYDRHWHFLPELVCVFSVDAQPPRVHVVAVGAVCVGGTKPYVS
jgi:hypothetical protein